MQAMSDMFYAWLFGLSGRGVSHQQSVEGIGGFKVRWNTREKGEDRVTLVDSSSNSLLLV